MASHYVYQLAKYFPRELKYVNAVCKLELVRGDMDGKWVFRAQKFVPSTFCEIISSRFGARALQTTLRNGFLVQEGTPAAKLLDRPQKTASRRSGGLTAVTFNECKA